MKYAPLLAGAAILMLMGVYATADYPSPETKTVPLDTTGITTLEMRGDSGAEIVISSRRSPSYSFTDVKGNKVSVLRSGDRLTIDAKVEDYRGVHVVVPPGVRSFLVRSATLEAEQPLERVELVVSHFVDWSGDVDELVMRDGIKTRQDKESGCRCKDSDRRNLTISEGRIGTLQVFSVDTSVDITEPEKIGHAILRLGRGELTLKEVKRLDHIELVTEPDDDSTPDDVADDLTR